MKVKRYDIQHGRDGYMEKDEYGDYVRHDDYVNLLMSVEMLAKDAERYRWLRKEHASDGPSYHVRRPSNYPAPHDLDADLDAAMSRTSAGIAAEY